MNAQILLVNGPIGAGKTAIVGEASALLRAADTPHAIVDFDWLSGYYPRDADDHGGRVSGCRTWWPSGATTGSAESSAC